jgi:NAD-dependent SIR2 family protein deacetylase
MPRVEQNSMPTSLHCALTDSQCSKCGKQLEWNANFDDINNQNIHHSIAIKVMLLV